MAVNVTGSSGIPADGTAGSAVVNLTGVAGSTSTYLSLFPTDSSGGCQYTGPHAPSFSTINLAAGAVQANRVMVALGPATTGGADTSVCVYNSSGDINVLIEPFRSDRDERLHAAVNAYVPLHRGCDGHIRLSRRAGNELILPGSDQLATLVNRPRHAAPAR